MDASPAALGFEARYLSGNPMTQDLSISNSGLADLTWTVSAKPSWITVNKTTDTAPAGSTSVISVGADISNIGPGTFSGVVTITSDFGDKAIIPVSITVLPPPVLTLGNGWLNFSTKKGIAPDAQTVALGIENVPALLWTAATGSGTPWLTVSPNSGTTSGSLSVSVNMAGLDAGPYTGYVTVLAPGALPDVSKINVNLTVTASNKLIVSTNLAESVFKITNTKNSSATYSGGGKSWSVEDLQAGDYTITFESVVGYKKPISQTFHMASEGDVTVNGTYVSRKDLAARRNILTAKGAEPTNDSSVWCGCASVNTRV
jgi:hypothetical protein